MKRLEKMKCFFAIKAWHNTTITMPIIANLTTRTYFVYNTKYPDTLKGLLQPEPNGKQKPEECGHWLRTDKIVFVPEHLCNYVVDKFDAIDYANAMRAKQMMQRVNN